MPLTLTKTGAMPTGEAVAAPADCGQAPRAQSAGSLTDADPMRETAQLTDLRNRQSAQGADAGCTPRTLLSLFGSA